MSMITNKKLSSLAPTWADFRGFTLLFENPGASLARRDSLEYVTAPSDIPLYKAVVSALQTIGLKELKDHYTFCRLSPESYHVTVCDGGNVDNCADVSASYRDALNEFLKGLPESVCLENPFSRFVSKSELVMKKDWNIRLEFDYLANWSNVSLVACLKPADAESAVHLNQLIQARDTLCANFGTLFNIKPPESYVPHITLGYFANTSFGEHAAECMIEWQNKFQNAMKGSAICFNSISMYGFTDMETFFRKAEILSAK